MLPEELSNNLCSLRPRQPRLTVSVLMEIGERGEVISSEFVPSLIQTVERMTYDSVFKIFEGDRAERRKYSDLLDDFNKMRALARLLRKRRLEEGSLDFDLAEPELFYESGKLTAIEAAEHNEAHRLIEEFMVAANVAVASFLGRKGIPTIYRSHPRPSPADLDKLRTFLMPFGFSLPEAKRIQSRDLQRILKESEGKPESKLLGLLILRAMKLAAYTEENLGHYGLGKSDYTHFTSPIRRYPDLVVHRILKAVLGNREPDEIPVSSVALHASERERNAADAEKALLEWRIFRFLKDHLGEEFMGTIVDINKAGLVVELDDYFVGGLLPYQALGGDYYARASAKTLRGRRDGRRFDLGDRLRVILASCDAVLQRMSFVLKEDSEKMSS
jgi:ribonuclease R